MQWRRRFNALLGAAALIATVAGMPAHAAGSCTASASGGGDWPSYGHDLSNTRTQDAEHTIGAANITSITPAWSFPLAAAGGTGNFQSIPAIADGCAFIATSKGWVFALNADNGALVWAKQAVPEVTGICCGGALYAPSVSNGTVYLHVASNPDTSPTHDGPYLLALDENTGEMRFRSPSVTTFSGAFSDASPVIFDGLDFMGISGAEGGNQRPGGFALIDVDPRNDIADGTILKYTHTVPDVDFDRGYAGGSIWGTAVVDPATKLAYVGTGQAATPDKEHPNTNAIIKVDIDRASSTFGEILDVAKGTQDGYVSGTTDQPACKASPSIVTCVRLDIDFGSSPNLFHDSDGRLMVGALQKIGIYHAVYAATMEHAWETTMSMAHGYENANISSPAVANGHVYVAGSAPAALFALRGDAGGYEWVSPIESAPNHDGSISTANGLVYTVSRQGFLDAIDETTGLPALHRQISLDTQGACLSSVAGGVAIARHTLYVVCGDGALGDGYTAGSQNDGYLVAYRLPA